MANSSYELAQELIDAPLVPFDQLPSYPGAPDYVELDGRSEPGYEIIQLYKKTGGEVVTLVFASNTMTTFEVKTPPHQAADNFKHTFAVAPNAVRETVFPARQEK